MSTKSIPTISTMESVLAKMKTSVGPVMEVLQRNDHFKVVVMGLNVDVMLPDHTTSVPTKLSVLKGSVIYRDADGNIPLFQYDEMTIPLDMAHSVRAIRPSLCLLTMG